MSEPQHPTGVPEVGRARRRWLLPAAGLAAVLVVALVAVVVTRPDPERPAARPAAASASPPATTGAVAPIVSPSSDLTATPTATPAASPTATLSRASTPTRRPAPARTTAAPTPRKPATNSTPKPGCTPAGVVDVVQVFTYGVVKVAARTNGEWTDQLCPGERIRVFWATYSRTPDGGAKLYRSEARYLDRSAPTWTMRLVLSGNCGDSWYVVAGNRSIPQTLKPGVVPFGNGKRNWDTGGPC